MLTVTEKDRDTMDRQCFQCCGGYLHLLAFQHQGADIFYRDEDLLLLGDAQLAVSYAQPGRIGDDDITKFHGVKTSCVFPAKIPANSGRERPPDIFQ